MNYKGMCREAAVA